MNAVIKTSRRRRGPRSKAKPITAAATPMEESVAEAVSVQPSWWMMALEGRSLLEWASWFLAAPWFHSAPRGDGHPVLVLPGLIAGDASTWMLRRFLAGLGYAAYPWDQGINRGPQPGLVERLQARLETLRGEHGKTVSLIGWSLGGAMARALAFQNPNSVRSVITLGSPLSGDGRSTNAWRVFEFASGIAVDDPSLLDMRGGHPSVPMTSILSKSDGVVPWQLSLAPQTPLSESIEVMASHLGMGANPMVLWAIADRLAQRPGKWKPFERSGWQKFFYNDPNRVSLENLFRR